MRLNKISILACVLAIVLLSAGCSSITGEDKATPSATKTAEPTSTVGTAPHVGYMAPGFELDNLDGQEVSLESLRGQYVMLNFLATWCGPCRMEMPYMQEIYEEGVWADRGVVIAAVNIGESASLARSFMDEFGFEFEILLDSETQTAAKYSVRAIPTTFFIDGDGIIKDIKVGTFSNRSEIETKLQSLIEG
jgi:peroxiredoxin